MTGAIVVHLLTIHAAAGRQAASVALAGIGRFLREHGIVWWVSPNNEHGDIKIMARIPEGMEAELGTLLDAHDDRR